MYMLFNTNPTYQREQTIMRFGCQLYLQCVHRERRIGHVVAIYKMVSLIDCSYYHVASIRTQSSIIDCTDFVDETILLDLQCRALWLPDTIHVGRLKTTSISELED